MSVFEKEDYRLFLKDFIEKRPRNGRGEMNKMATFIGVHPSLLSQVLGKTKNLSLEQAQLLSEYLGLIPKEVDYFICSVHLQRAGTVKLRHYFREALTKLRYDSQEITERVRQDRKLTEEEKSIFYSHWLFAAIWLETSIGKGCELEDVSARFEISRERANQILLFLVETKLCILVNGIYSMGPQSIHLERKSMHLPKHHTNWRLRAIELSDRIEAGELMYTAPISLSKTDFENLRARLADVIKEVTDVAIQSEAQEIACFNLDFFRIKK